MAEQTELSEALRFSQMEVLSRIDKIEQTLKQADPMLPIHCQEIHKALQENEELVHILPDDRIRIYVAGIVKYKNIKLIEEAAASRKKGKVTAEDL